MALGVGWNAAPGACTEARHDLNLTTIPCRSREPTPGRFDATSEPSRTKRKRPRAILRPVSLARRRWTAAPFQPTARCAWLKAFAIVHMSERTTCKSPVARWHLLRAQASTHQTSGRRACKKALSTAILTQDLGTKRACNFAWHCRARRKIAGTLWVHAKVL